MVSHRFADITTFWIVSNIYPFSFIICSTETRKNMSYLCLVSIVPKRQTRTALQFFQITVFGEELCLWHENISFLWKLRFWRQETSVKALPAHTSVAGAWSGKALKNPGTHKIICRAAWKLMATWECFSPHWIKLLLYITLCQAIY